MRNSLKIGQKFYTSHPNHMERSVTLCNHDSKISESQQLGALATTTATATRTAKKQQVQIGKTITLHLLHAFLYVSQPSLNDCEMKLPNFTRLPGGRVGEHNTNVLFFFYLFLNLDIGSGGCLLSSYNFATMTA